MKKLITLMMLLAISLASSQKTHAQVPNVDLIFAGDSSFSAYCSLPDTVNFFFYGYAPGYASTDSIHMQINFGDGTTLSYYVLLIQGPTFYGNVDHIYTIPGAYAVQFIATGSDGSADTLVDQSVLISSSCGDISGRIYLDSNNDCIYNTGDTPIQTWITATYNGSQVAGGYSNALGEYNLSVPSGFTYVVEPSNNQLNISCPVSGNYTITSLPSTGKDFALECDTQFDYKSMIGGQGFRVNGNSWLWLHTWNEMLSCTPPNATVTLTLDPMLSYVSSTVTPISVTSTQVVFNAGSLMALFSSGFTSTMQVLTDPAAMIGDTLCVTLTVDPQTGDANPANNIYTACMPVRNSCDPNEKHEIHAGVVSASIAPGTRLDYTIMFQNVGNDTAYSVRIIDELDPSLDLSTLSITGFSHPASIFLVDNTLKFEFNNINLAAASVNEPLSHGYVTYSIDHFPGIANGTAITNDADIYFDFNAPIITNTVTDIIDQSLGLDEFVSSSISLYPNPAHDYFIISGITGNAVLSIMDVTGRIISKSVVANNQLINTRNFSKGFYLVTLESNGGKMNSPNDKLRAARLVVE